MLVLGIHSLLPFRDSDDIDPEMGWGHHDAAAVLVEDGRVVAAIEEERLNRVKHSSAFPLRAAGRCLAEAGVRLEDVDRVAIAFSEAYADRYFLRRALDNAAAPLGSGRAQVARLLEREFGWDASERVRFVGHHTAHLWSAFQPSGFDSGLAVSIDGVGESLSGAVATFQGTRLRLLRELPVRKSLGFFYRECITQVGYTRFDEYKVMGLAPYGDADRYAELFAQAYRLLPEGDYEVLTGDALVLLMEDAGLARHARRKGEPFNQAHRDFSAALQRALERIVFHLLSHWRDATGARSLCLAGGVAHNCSMNGRIAYSGLFDRVWVQPAAHDAGNALGAALAVLHDEGAPLASGPLRQVYLGSGIPDDGGVERALRGWGGVIGVERCGDVAAETARLLAGGAVVGWVQGRSEFGPRALGNRSILADPRPAENKDRINAMVKKREGYRPFAPSVRLERAGDFFELPPSVAEFPFMTFALRVRPEARALLGAVTHVDGTARVQTVARDASPRYWALLRAFEERTGVPVLLNTSFNNHAEPIVDSVDEAVACFLTTGLDALVVGDHLVRKQGGGATGEALAGLSPSLPASRKLVMRTGAAGAREHELESTGGRHFGEKAAAISAHAFAILCAADGVRTLGELLDGIGGVDADGRRALLDEMAELWSRRAVVLRPPAAPAEKALDGDADRSAESAVSSAEPRRPAAVAGEAGGWAAPLPAHALAETAGGAADAGASAVFLFPGVGDQYPGMGRGLYQAEPVFRDEVDRCAEILRLHLGSDLRDALFAADDEPPAPAGTLDLRRLLGRAPVSDAAARLARTEVAQPAAFVAGYALARLWESWGVRPAALLGHSLGEYTAACVAGVFTLEDALELVALRARSIQGLPEGAVLAVPLGPEEVAPFLGDAALAAVNAPELCVLAGTDAAIADAERRLAAAGHASRRLPATHAFHSPLLRPAAERVAAMAGRMRLRPPAIPLLSNLTGTWLTAAQATDPEYWAGHLLGTVQFARGAAELLRHPGRVLVEMGPGGSLGTFVRQQGAASGIDVPPAVASLPHAAEDVPEPAFLLDALRRARAAGVEADGGAMADADDRPRVSLSAPDAAAERADAPAAEEGEVLRVLAGVWADLLGGEPGPEDDFFLMGGHSLVATRLIERVQVLFGVEMRLRTLFQTRTLGAMARWIRSAAGTAPAVPAAAEAS